MVNNEPDNIDEHIKFLKYLTEIVSPSETYARCINLDDTLALIDTLPEFVVGINHDSDLVYNIAMLMETRYFKSQTCKKIRPIINRMFDVAYHNKVTDTILLTDIREFMKELKILDTSVNNYILDVAENLTKSIILDIRRSRV